MKENFCSLDLMYKTSSTNCIFSIICTIVSNIITIINNLKKILKEKEENNNILNNNNK